jgi:hypothetical protein
MVSRKGIANWWQTEILDAGKKLKGNVRTCGARREGTAQRVAADGRRSARVNKQSECVAAAERGAVVPTDPGISPSVRRYRLPARARHLRMTPSSLLRQALLGLLPAVCGCAATLRLDAVNREPCVTGVLTNIGKRPLDVWTGCRASDTSNFSLLIDDKPAFLGDGLCCFSPPLILRLAPGQSKSFTSGVLARGDHAVTVVLNVPSGRHYPGRWHGTLKSKPIQVRVTKEAWLEQRCGA